MTSVFDVFLTPAAAGPVYTVTLPAGLKLLNANDRVHHQQRAAITKALRSAAAFAAFQDPHLRRALIAARPEPLLCRAHILGVLHPGNRGRRDPANYYPSFKAAVDGLVDAGLFEDDDSAHVHGPDMRLGPVVKRSQLVLHIRELPGVAR